MRRSWLHVAEFDQRMTKVTLKPKHISLKTPRDNNSDNDCNSLFHINIQPVNSKIEELEAFLELQHIDIICLTEHWLKSELSNIGSNFISLSTFSRTKYKTGGVAIFCRKAKYVK